MDYSNLTVWVVEDDLPSWGVITRLLEALGISDFTLTMNSDMVVQALQKGVQIDVILIDVHLKNDNGYDLLNFLQSHSEETKNIMISASSGPGGVREAQIASADGFIGKPLTLGRLREALDKVLQGESYWD
jgi:CheY-like chemotaxis protein